MRGFDTLMHAVSPNAFHNSNSRPDPPKCHENTRVVVIDKIMDWVTGKIDTDTIICWLYGPAGSGKTAIARSVAEFCTEQGHLLASFLFLRPDAKCNTMAPLVANIAYCVTRLSSDARQRIEAVIETDPLIFSYSVKEQFTKLVLEPLQLLEHKKHLFPKLVVIDGLDECLDKDAQTNLIKLLSSSTALPLKFLISSRPEPHIKSAIFRHRSKISRLQLNGDFAPEEDIRRFLTDKFREIKSCQPLNSRIPSFSPSEEQVDDLTRKASGQFIYASLAVRFINSNSDSPIRRLDIVLGIHPPTYPDHPFAELDALYIFILNSSDNPSLVRRILGVNAALDETDSIQDTAAIEAVLGLKDGDVGMCLRPLSSVLEVEEDRAGEKIVFHHPFFMDFLRTAERTADYYVDDRESHSLIAQWILQVFTSNAPTASRRAANPWLQRMDLISHLTHSLLTLDLERALEKFSFSAFLDAAIDSGTQQQSRDTLTKTFLNYLKDNGKHELQSPILESYPTTDPPSYLESQSVPVPSSHHYVPAFGTPVKLTHTQSMSILPSEARDYFDVPNHRVQRASNSLPNLIDADAKGGSDMASRKRKKMDNEFTRPVKRIFRDGHGSANASGSAPPILESYPTTDSPSHLQSQSVSEPSAYRDVVKLRHMRDDPKNQVQQVPNSLPSTIDVDANKGSNVATKKRKKMDNEFTRHFKKVFR